MKYRVKMIGGVGQHDCGIGPDGQPTMIGPGDSAVTDKPLHEIFPDKFQLIEEVAEAAEALATASASASKPAGKKAAKKAPTEASAASINVTDRFPSAASAGLIINQVGTTFSILRGEEVLVADLANESLVVTEIDDIAAEAK